jgi:hypothetical protein
VQEVLWTGIATYFVARGVILVIADVNEMAAHDLCRCINEPPITFTSID